MVTSKLRLDRIASSTRNARLGPEVLIGPEILSEEGRILAVRIGTDKAVYNQVEDPSDRLIRLRAGDVLAGVLGARRALRGYEGEVPESLAAGDTIEVLNLGGVLGRCTAGNPDLGPPFTAEILGAGLRELSGQAQVRLAADTGDRGGPGLTVKRLKSARPKDTLRLSLPSFEIRTKHDLLANPDLFGLRLLTTSTSHLPRLGPIPLAISGGVQDVLARFFAEGFEAAAITAFAAVTGALFELPYDVTNVSVDFDRPFGFLAVHRPSRLAVVAGWVKSPFEPV